MKIIDYKTVTGSDVEKLDPEVKKLIGHGFQPFGNPYFGTLHPETMDKTGFFQAMIRQHVPLKTSNGTTTNH